eukprot:Rhum_TRINITY_DN14517_c2_g2::Rhum_TRINITY_DN14517_c2_g2_i1::g.95245::m.95245
MEEQVQLYKDRRCLFVFYICRSARLRKPVVWRVSKDEDELRDSFAHVWRVARAGGGAQCVHNEINESACGRERHREEDSTSAWLVLVSFFFFFFAVFCVFFVVCSSPFSFKWPSFVGQVQIHQCCCSTRPLAKLSSKHLLPALAFPRGGCRCFLCSCRGAHLNQHHVFHNVLRHHRGWAGDTRLVVAVAVHSPTPLGAARRLRGRRLRLHHRSARRRRDGLGCRRGHKGCGGGGCGCGGSGSGSGRVGLRAVCRAARAAAAALPPEQAAGAAAGAAVESSATRCGGVKSDRYGLVRRHLKHLLSAFFFFALSFMCSQLLQKKSIYIFPDFVLIILSARLFLEEQEEEKKKKTYKQNTHLFYCRFGARPISSLPLCIALLQSQPPALHPSAKEAVLKHSTHHSSSA